jgi:hypothetical protein
MNDTPNTASVDAGVAKAPFHFNEATGRFEDIEGNPVEVTSEEVAVTGEGEVADVTVH